jgi:hypothetical protein
MLPPQERILYPSQFVKEAVDAVTKVLRWGHPRPFLPKRIAQTRIYQTKETHVFALAHKLLCDFETHQAAEGVSCKKIGAVRLRLSDFGDVIGGHFLDRASNLVPSIQRQWL